MTRPPPPPPAAQYAAPRRPGPSLLASLLTLGIGLAVIIPSVVLAVIPFVGVFTSTPYSAPAHLSIHLRHGEYTVYERTGTRSVLGGIRDNRSLLTISPSQVAVTAPDGSGVPVSFDTANERTSSGNGEYTGAVVFHAPATGTYDIRLRTRPTTVLIARSLQDVVSSVVVWLAGAGLGFLVAVTGLVLLIVGATRRGRARRAMQWSWAQQQWGVPQYPGAQYPGAPYPPQHPPPPPGPPPQ